MADTLGCVRMKSLQSGDVALAALVSALGVGVAVLYTGVAVAESAHAGSGTALAAWAQAVLSWGFVAALWLLHTRQLAAAVGLIGLNIAWSVVWILAPVNLGYSLWVVTVPLAVFVARRDTHHICVPWPTLSPRIVALAAAGWALISPFMWTWDERYLLFYRSGLDAALTLALHWAVIAVAYLWALNRAAEQAAREREARGRENQLIQAREEERLAVAREIHDVLGHTLTLIKAQANAGLVANTERESLEQITSVAADALTDIRLLVRGLRDDDTTLSPAAGIQDLPQVVARFREAGVHVTLDVPQHVAVPAITSLAAHRIVTEAVTNATRHQENPEVRVTLVPQPDALEVTVTSTGRISPHAGAGIGLVGLRERAASTGGTLETTRGGNTFTVHAVLGV